MIKPTLLVLAAGMGSRYGSLKQMDGVGPNGEAIIDYSVYDAIRAGFGKVVFVIRRDFAQDFKDIVISKFENKIPVEIVYQDITALPEGFTPNPERVKPWGTNHAILMGKDVVKEPFAVINGDDFYGYESFQVLADQLVSMTGKKGEYCMVGFPVKNTLSESGTVSRGVCQTNAAGNLESIEEHTKIESINGSIVNHNDDGTEKVIAPDTPVSMNMWGFTPDYFANSEGIFTSLLEKNINELKAEFYIPFVIDSIIKQGIGRCEMLSTSSRWFGVTFQEDRPGVVAKFQEFADQGIYPTPLYEK